MSYEGHRETLRDFGFTNTSSGKIHLLRGIGIDVLSVTFGDDGIGATIHVKEPGRRKPYFLHVNKGVPREVFADVILSVLRRLGARS